MLRPHDDRPNFFQSFFGLVLSPGDTTSALFEVPRPPYIGSLFCLMLLSVLGPLAFQAAAYGYSAVDLTTLKSLMLAGFCAVGAFGLIEAVFLAILGFGFHPVRALACLAYASAPIVVATWLLYIFNYLGNGHLTLTTIIFTGEASHDDPTLRSLPYVVGIAQIMMAIVFFYSIRFMAKLSAFNGFLVALGSLVPLYGSVLLGFFAADIVRPGTIALLLKLLKAPGLHGG